jgi:uncharacterized protein (TIGR02271 family)
LTRDCGCDRSDIGLMARGEQTEAGRGAPTSEHSKDIASGAMKGAGTGAAVGGILGLVAGVASLAIPGIGPIIAAGPIASALAGVGIGAVAGGLIGALTRVGVSEEDAHYYTEGVKRGGTLITLHARDDRTADCAVQVMKRHGAVDIDQRAEQWRQEGWTGRATEEQVIPVAQEELVVGKREVARGGVRVYAQVIEKAVEQKVELREEHANVERHPVDRPVSAGDDVFKERSIDVSETAEEPVVGKRSRITEEVRVGKETAQREQTVQDTVRQTEVQIEKASPASSYRGPERRKQRSSYSGAERRMALR